MAAPRLGVLIPIYYPQTPPSRADLTAFCQAAEGLGFDSLWVTERYFHPIPILHSFTTLTWAAAVTQRIRLGTAVLLAPLWTPPLLARAAVTLDVLSEGRFTLGLSLGGQEAEFAAAAVPMRQRALRLQETALALRKLWTEDGVQWKGRLFELRGVTVLPKPVQKPTIPILFGAATEPALKRAGELADGWLGGTAGTPEQVRERWQTVQRFAAAAGRDPTQLECGKILYTCVDADRERARGRLQGYLEAYYGPGRIDVETACAFGPAPECAQRLQAYGEAGVKTLLLGIPGPDLGQLEAVASQVMPLLG